MAGETLDQVSFALLADISKLKASYAEAEALTDKLGAKIKAVGGTGLTDAAKGVSAVSGAAKAAASEVENLGKKTAMAHGNVAIATREFRALFDELSSGRARMAPGTLAIIATRVFGINAATLAWGAALAAIPIGLAVMAAVAESSLSRIDRALAITGNSTGMVRGQIQLLAETLSHTTSMSTLGAQNMLSGLLAHGNIPAGDIAQAASTASNLAIATGEKPAVTQKLIDEVFAKPAEAAQQLDANMKLLTAAQDEQVKELVAMGEKQRAAELVLGALSDRTRDAASNLSVFAGIVQGAGKILANFANWAGQQVADHPFQNAIGLATFGLGSGFGKWLDERAGTALKQTSPPAFGAGPDWTKNNDLIDQAMGKADDRFDVAGRKAREHAQDMALFKGALAAAKTEYAAYQAELAKNPGDEKLRATTQASKEIVERLTVASRNAANPNYNPGSGVRRGRSVGENEFYREAQTAREELEIRKKVAETDEGHRKTVEATLKAQLEYQRNLLNPKARPYAATIRDTKIAEAGLDQQTEAADTLAAAKQKADSEERIALAYAKSSAEGARQKAIEEALSAARKNAAIDTDALTDANLRAAQAAAKISVEQRLNQGQTDIAGLRRELAAGGNPAALAAAKRETEALAITQVERENARTKEQIALAAQHLSQLRQELALRAQLDLQIAANDEDVKLQQVLAMKQLELSLQHATAEERAKEISDLATLQQMLAEGWSQEMPGFQKELEYRRQINEQIALTEASLQGQTASAQLMGTLRNGLENIGLAGVRSFHNMKEAAASFLDELAQVIMKTQVMDPLLNMLFGKQGGGGAGGFIGKLFGSMGGGAKGAENAATIQATASLTALSASASAASAALLSLTISSSANKVGKLAGNLFGGGLADGGPLDASQWYVVGERGPEILGPGVSGHITPIKAPNAGAMGANDNGPLNVTHTMHLNISGNGDAELKAQMQAGMRQYFDQSIKAYDAHATRTMRSKYAAQNKRSMTP